MRPLLKPLNSHRPAVATRRHLSAESLSSPPPLPSLDPSSSLTQALSLLQTADPTSWSTCPNLKPLLTSLAQPTILKIGRQLPNYQHALHFYNHLKTSPEHLDSLPFALQALLEHAMRENPNSPDKLYELFVLAKDQKTPLSINAATLLIRRFIQANMVDEMLMVFDYVDDRTRNTHLFNVVIAELLGRGRVDDAWMLLGEMLLTNSHCPPNTSTAHIVFSAILKRNWGGRSLSDGEIYELVSGFLKHGISLNGFQFTKIITSLCLNRKYDKAWDILHKAMNSKCDVITESCNALLTGLGFAQDFEKMNLLMKEMIEKGIKPNVVTYGITIRHLCKSRRVEQALELLEKMRDGEIGIQPDVISYNMVIDGMCKVGMHEGAFKLMERMRLDSSCRPNSITYNCLLDGFCKAGEIERALELFEQMKKDGVEPNVVTLNTLLDGMCRHKRVGSALDFFGSMKERDLKGNVITYTTLITALCNVNNFDKAMKLFEEMLGNGCSPDAIVYYSLISGFSRAGRMDDADGIASKLKEAGFYLDLVSYNVLINGYCRTNRIDKASEIVKDMEEAGMAPDCITYNTLISFFSAKGEFTKAHRLMKKMTSDGLTPTAITYGALIQAYCSNNDIDAAMKLFKDVSSSLKVRPNTVIYNMLIESLCKKNDVETAVALMDDMKNKEVRPNSTTYNALFKGLQQMNWLEKALKYMDQMTEQACNPDYITMEILTQWLSNVGETEKLRKFVQGYQVSA